MHGSLVICEQCDCVHRRVRLPNGSKARCHRCGAVMYSNRYTDLDALLALALAALIVFVIANVYPIVDMELGGERTETTLWGAVLASYSSGVGFVAALAAAMVFFFPLVLILATLYVLVPERFGLPAPHFSLAMHLLRLFRPWSMVEVFLLGVMVALVKMAGDAEVIPGIGLWGFAILTLLMTLLNAVDLHRLWPRLEDMLE